MKKERLDLASPVLDDDVAILGGSSIALDSNWLFSSDIVSASFSSLSRKVKGKGILKFLYFITLNFKGGV